VAAHVSNVAIPVTRPASRRRFWKTAFYRKKVVPWLFILPILVINIAVVAGPALASIYYSMTDWSGVGAA
jgi:raffinose/stachyose/melibiose transport system permease protein